MLDKHEIRRLQAEAHHLKPEFQVGKEGLNDALVASICDGFNTKELLKVKMLDTSPDDRATLKEKLSALPGITLIQNIGHTYILYKKLEEKPKSGDGRYKKDKDPKPKKQLVRKPSLHKKSVAKRHSPRSPRRSQS
jgi:RNA-binding protein